MGILGKVVGSFLLVVCLNTICFSASSSSSDQKRGRPSHRRGSSDGSGGFRDRMVRMASRLSPRRDKSAELNLAELMQERVELREQVGLEGSVVNHHEVVESLTRCFSSLAENEEVRGYSHLNKFDTCIEMLSLIQAVHMNYERQGGRGADLINPEKMIGLQTIVDELLGRGMLNVVPYFEEWPTTLEELPEKSGVRELES
ncbi:hypothetical protein K2X40_00970 [Candidatus Babeliales bacterium]|nr:hypothetical protein [Candidatus Babeliales bacterium]